MLDQGNLGACTGFAGIGCLGTGLLYQAYMANPPTTHEVFEFTYDGAVELYSDATSIDPYPGKYPPDDTGSDGLSIAKVLKYMDAISGYQHTFSLDDALLALTKTPFITGTYWYDGMFEPHRSGQVFPSGGIAGGHEYVADELDVENKRIWFTNSWGTGWGVNGRFWMAWEDYGALLKDDGDVTVLLPVSEPAPQPVPVPPTPPVPPAPVDPITPADAVLWKQVKGWANGWHWLTNAKAAKAVKQWAQTKKLS